MHFDKGLTSLANGLIVKFDVKIPILRGRLASCRSNQ